MIPHRAAGYLIQKELEFLGQKTQSPDRPFIVILGGAKVSDKITVIDRLLDKADTIIIGGGMAYTFALANGQTVGDSLCEPDKVELAREAMKKAEEKGVKFMLPVDYLVTDALDFGNKTLGATQVVEGSIPDGWRAKVLMPGLKPSKCTPRKFPELNPSFGMGQWEYLRLRGRARVHLL